MHFCPNCGSFLDLRVTESGDTALVTMACKKCGYRSKELNDSEKLELKTIKHTPKQMVAVIGKKNQLDVLPTIYFECPNCGNNKAYVWQVQTRGADESSTQFIRCTRRNYTQRENT